jgi:hypothetical protein
LIGSGIFCGTWKRVRFRPLRRRRPGSPSALAVSSASRSFTLHLLAPLGRSELLEVHLASQPVLGLHDHLAPLAVERQRLVADLPHEEQRLPRRLAQGQEQLVAVHLGLDRPAHRALRAEEAIRRRQA